MIAAERYEAWMASRTKHGGYAGGVESPEHYIWRAMHARCSNKSRAEYARYGGRGIEVCARWSDFASFIADMGPRPGPDYSLERIDNDGSYTPDNCQWATRSTQQKNKHNTRRYTNGVFIGTPAECAKYLGISRALASYRMRTWGTYEKGIAWCLLPKSV